MTDDLKSREMAARGIFTPELEYELKRGRESGHGILRDIGWGWFLIVAAIALVAFVFAGRAFGAEFHSNPYLLTWIPQTCCVTNDCCWEISERELTPMPHDSWQVNATGQVLPRTKWSPDGKFYRCACDLAGSGKWIRHQGANTRCVFPAARSF